MGRFDTLAARSRQEHHVGLEQTGAALRAIWHVEAGKVAPLQIGVAIGRSPRAQRRPGGVAPQQLGLQGSAWTARMAMHAAHGVDAAMQISVRWLPAAWCRPSTFWVSSSSTRPAPSRAASAWCAAPGRARAITGQPSRLRAQ